MSRRIFLAGAGGAVGRRLCPLLVRNGWQVFGTTRSTAKAAGLRALGVQPVIVDVFDEPGLRRAVAEARPEAVIHQLTDLPPGLDPAGMDEGRVRTARIREIGTRHLLAAALSAGARRMVAQSLAFAYAPGPMPYGEDSPLGLDAPEPLGSMARGIAGLEEQVLNAPLEGVILRYGQFYGPGTGFDAPSAGGPVHVDAAAYAALLAVIYDVNGIYNIAEEDGAVSSRKAMAELGWRPDFRLEETG